MSIDVIVSLATHCCLDIVCIFYILYFMVFDCRISFITTVSVNNNYVWYYFYLFLIYNYRGTMYIFTSNMQSYDNDGGSNLLTGLFLFHHNHHHQQHYYYHYHYYYCYCQHWYCDL